MYVSNLILSLYLIYFNHNNYFLLKVKSFDKVYVYYHLLCLSMVLDQFLQFFISRTELASAIKRYKYRESIVFQNLYS